LSKNRKRGGQPYNPPKGYYRYGLNVTGRYDNGDDTWLGMKNIPGEWCIAYHGTAHQNVKSIVNPPLRARTGHFDGKGIYCSPNINIASRHSKTKLELNTIDGKISFSYVFMCQVNVGNIHHCCQTPCPDAENPVYTVHYTRNKDIWFANGDNAGYNDIRLYGILVTVNK
jgi:hypothetical protein